MTISFIVEVLQFLLESFYSLGNEKSQLRIQPQKSKESKEDEEWLITISMEKKESSLKQKPEKINEYFTGCSD